MTYKWLGILVFFCALLKFSEPSTSTQGLATALSPLNDERPRLQISAPSSIFHRGELIPLTVSFTSKIPDRYQVNMARYDRSGRMGYEKFLVEPTDGTVDPLTVYFKSASVLMSGGFTNFKLLSNSPYEVYLDLNEWIRFDVPGHYRVSVTSRRVSDVSGGKSFYQGIIQDLKSNSIDIEIVESDVIWQQEQLKNILLDLDGSPHEPGPFLTDFRSGALRRLRYLGSEDAARELARHMRSPQSAFDTQNAVDWNCMFGLIGSPNRMSGLAEMKKLLEVPDFPVTELFLTTMAMIPLDPDDSAANLRPQKESNLIQARSMLLNNLSVKQKDALAVSLDTALHNMNPNTPTEMRSKLVGELINNFTALPRQKQLDWLGKSWSSVSGPQWLPVLRTLAVQETDIPQFRSQGANDLIKLTGLALTRWYELDPEGARKVVLAEIVRPKPRYGANTLGILPDTVLVGEQELIAEHFVETNRDIVGGNLASLLNRYADKSVLPKVLVAIEQNEGRAWECVVLLPTLAYVAKVDPDKAKSLTDLRKDGVTACQRVDWWFDRP